MNTSKTEEVKQLIDQGIASLVKNLEHGKSDQLMAYITAMARFHRYSFRNIMLIVSQFPEASLVAGFRAWKKLGRFVKKGEQGITIIAPMVFKSGEGDNTNDPEACIRFKAAHVFDVSQTDGDALPEPDSIQGDPGAYTARVKSLIEAKGITLEYTDALESALGSSSGSRIRIVNNLSPASEFSVLVHELAHEMLHWSDQALVTRNKTVRETEAEAVAFIVSSAIELNNNTASSDYIQLFDGTVETLEASLDAIRKTASEIIDAIAASDA